MKRNKSRLFASICYGIAGFIMLYPLEQVDPILPRWLEIAFGVLLMMLSGVAFSTFLRRNDLEF